MSKAYIPGPEADEIIARQVAKGHLATADDVVRASLHRWRKTKLSLRMCAS